MRQLFDDHKADYRSEVQGAISFMGANLDFYTEAKAGHLVRIAERCLGNIASLEVLDLGCGVGLTDKYLVGRFGRVHGLDISSGALGAARESNPSADYRQYDGDTIPYPDAEFDLVFAINVLHHVYPTDRPALVRETSRVTKSGGIVAIFEHNPLNPLTRLAVRRCSFDSDAMLMRSRELAQLVVEGGLDLVEHRHILFFPFRGRVSAEVEKWLAWLPLGAQHYAVGRKRRADDISS